jgi:hypothetical protein
MPSARRLISSQTLGRAAATVTFSGISSGYRDLILRSSTRGSQVNANTNMYIQFNNDTSTLYSWTYLDATGTSASSGQISGDNQLRANKTTADNATANTFSSYELYLPSYTVSQSKPILTMNAQENNTTANGDWYVDARANLYRSNTAISSVTFSLASGNFMIGSSFYLYGLLPA